VQYFADADTDQIKTAIMEILADDDGDRVMIGDFLLIAEITPESGEMFLLTMHNNEMTRWKELGFLHDRVLEIGEGHFVLGGGDEVEEV
jgi:hypothetical protein